jgi:hypothetical protein
VEASSSVNQTKSPGLFFAIVRSSFTSRQQVQVLLKHQGDDDTGRRRVADEVPPEVVGVVRPE